MRQSNTFKIFQNLIRINFINFDLETNFRTCDCLGLSKSCDSLSLDSLSLDSTSLGLHKLGLHKLEASKRSLQCKVYCKQ